MIPQHLEYVLENEWLMRTHGWRINSQVKNNFLKSHKYSRIISIELWP